MKQNCLLFLLCLFSALQAMAQSDSVREEKVRRNIIKLNLTSGILYKNSPQVEYERIVGKNQSFAVQIGFVNLPFGSNPPSDSLHWGSDLKKSGYSMTADYRFYLAHENKEGSPHGVYIGPYMSYYKFANDRTGLFGTTPEPITLHSRVDVVSLGVQLGYQFVLGKHKRWTIDCIVFGPSITHYKVNMNLAGNLDPSQATEVVQQILERMTSQYPVLGNLLQQEEVTFKGKADTWSAGFRYSVHFGFRF